MTWTKVSLNEAKRCATAKTSSPSTRLTCVVSSLCYIRDEGADVVSNVFSKQSDINQKLAWQGFHNFGSISQQSPRGIKQSFHISKC